MQVAGYVPASLMGVSVQPAPLIITYPQPFHVSLANKSLLGRGISFGGFSFWRRLLVAFFFVPPRKLLERQTSAIYLQTFSFSCAKHALTCELRALEKGTRYIPELSRRKEWATDQLCSLQSNPAVTFVQHSQTNKQSNGLPYISQKAIHMSNKCCSAWIKKICSGTHRKETRNETIQNKKSPAKRWINFVWTFRVALTENLGLLTLIDCL